jgi:hypothetical protein
VLFEMKLTYPKLKDQSQNLQNRKKKFNKLFFFKKNKVSKCYSKQNSPIQSSKTEAETYKIEKKI